MELFVALLKSLQKYFFIDQLKSKSSITIQGVLIENCRNVMAVELNRCTFVGIAKMGLRGGRFFGKL